MTLAQVRVHGWAQQLRDLAVTLDSIEGLDAIADDMDRWIDATRPEGHAASSSALAAEARQFRAEVEHLRRTLKTAAGDIEHELSPLVGWLRLGPACTTDEERRATIARLTRAIQVLSPEWTVSEEIRPTESAALVALAAARQEGAVQALREAAADARYDAAWPGVASWLNGRANVIENEASREALRTEDPS